jgi:DNA mismatch endonuclease, patch repair protein
MADKITSSRRSQNMAAIRATDTKPELVVRRLIHSLGYRYRLHAKDLPGKPDIVFRSRRKIIFVHGCFWHLHSRADCLDARLPKTNTGYWTPKLEKNVERDGKHFRSLAELGWHVLIVWDCETKNHDNLRQRLTAFLSQ